MLRDPGAHSVHLPWVRAARERLAGFDYAMLDALLPGGPYAPDFFAPPPRTPLPDVAEELERVRATEPAQVRRELGWRFEGDAPAVVRPLLDDPPPRHRGARRPDGRLLGARARAVVGPAAARCSRPTSATAPRASPRAGRSSCSPGCTPGVRWHRGTLEVEAAVDAEVELAGRGLQLVPVRLRLAPHRRDVRPAVAAER